MEFFAVLEMYLQSSHFCILFKCFGLKFFSFAFIVNTLLSSYDFLCLLRKLIENWTPKTYGEVDRERFYSRTGLVYILQAELFGHISVRSTLYF